ncbi:MAG: ATP-binding cassette domain-containing protein [Lachnospiraceae bacterium]|nr:ATP-binding cassette domain-containing protein [Lachnospiraceae bacterium]
MGWFDTQLRDRERLDQDNFTEAFMQMAGAVMGTREYERFWNEKERTETALAEILKFYHLKAVAVPDSVDDFHDALEYVMRPAGIMYRPVNLDEGWTRDAIGPLLARRRSDGAVVALLPNRMGDFRHLRRHEKEYEQDAICFYKPFPLRKLKIRDLLTYMGSILSFADIGLMLITTLVITGLGLLIPKLTNLLLSGENENKNTMFMMTLFLFFACTSISSLLFTSAKNVALSRINSKMSVAVEAATMMRILSLPTSFFKKYSAGELADRAGYMNTLCSMILNVLFSTGLTAVFSLSYIGQIFVYAPALVTPAITLILVTLVFTVITTLLQLDTEHSIMEHEAKERGLSYALINGIQKIRLSGSEKRAFSKWAHMYAHTANLTYNLSPFLKLNGVLSLAITLIGTIVLYAAAIKSHVSVTNYYSFNVAYNMVSGAFLSLAGVTASFAEIRSVLGLVEPILKEEPEVTENKHVVTKLSGGIELNHVTFRYEEGSPVILDDMSVKIPAGQYVAIVGKTGCGKSTLLRLLLGFETPSRGSIYYDQKDLRTLDLKSLRQNIGVVMQSGKLFQGDIYSNIVVSAPHLSVQDAWEAAEIAGIADDIREMPMGMYTMIGEGCGGISGGQKQRLMIARAIAQKPKILFLDEATSALDNITQKRVSDALTGLKCTRIVIAHRLSTIRQCDRILVMEDGRIEEEGTYDELMKKQGFFAELVERQRINSDD